ncbi:hypothetical protein [Turicibacter sanguinis]|uniref:hypothetical protein n=1 Tax=Turicibacter sanguinis TaxID=154288 RepID=UPI0021D4CFE6|nr:hypothetical protein [Turicibacter sanguinis]MCU7201192.1 hypothetical protein [Turicibacter sanguinis]
MFLSEADLVDASLANLLKEFIIKDNEIEYIQEPKGLFGIPDLIVFNGDVISIEYKLKNWKQAMKQAFRYKCFSSETYVILDHYYSAPAIKNIDEFKKFNIGLASVDEDRIYFYYRPIVSKPYNNQLYNKALKMFIENPQK